MFTRHLVPLATPRGFSVLLAAASLTASLYAQGNLAPGTVRFGSPNSIHSALAVSSNVPERSNVHPQLDANSGLGYAFYNLDPETQGDLMMIHQRYVAAVDAYRRAPRESAVVWNKLGIAYQHMYALDFAKLQYEKALSINPKYGDAMNNLGTVFYGQKDYHKAETYYRKALRIKPETASFYSNLGTAYFSDHKYKQGIEAYQRAFAIDPEIFIRETNERIQELGPVEEQARLNFTLAKMYAQVGNLKAAIAYLRAAMNEGFDDRKKIMGDKDFATLRETPEFHLLLTEQHMEQASNN
jgi:tetratricopeptide (TPR) repeat protein